ncbi:MAG: sel1 repeat family protein [Bacteroidetes bacterium]|nr:sel1 repeat family protein [Bacteroidota bacterium]
MPKMMKKVNSDLSAKVIFGSMVGISLFLAGCADSPESLKRRAETGDLKSVVQLGDAYLEGSYEGQPMYYQPEEACRLYRKAGEQGYPKGMWKYGRCQLTGTGTKFSPFSGVRWILGGVWECYRDRKKSIQDLEQEAAMGSAKSQYLLALIYRDGIGVDPDPVRAMQLLEKASVSKYADSETILNSLKLNWANFKATEKKAQQGDSSAMIRYAAYFNGNQWNSLKMKQDDAKAFHYLEKSSQRSPEGKLALARHLARTELHARARIRKLSFAAAESGYQPAMEWIAGLSGQALTEDGTEVFTARESFDQCRKLAQADLRSAQILLAKKYLNGDGAAVSPESAIPWLKRAATPPVKDNSPLGQFRYGVIGIFEAFAEALTGPDRGDREAQFLLGECYRDGVGVRKNLTEAQKWFRLSAENGNSDAKTALAFIDSVHHP